MAFMNAQEREALQQELTDLNNYTKIKRRLIMADQKGRLAFFRNAQHSGQLETRYDLEGLGTRVTIIEKHSRELDKSEKFWNSNYEIKDIVVEALPENRM